MALEWHPSQLTAEGSGWLGMSGGVSGKVSVCVCASVNVRLVPLLVEVKVCPFVEDDDAGKVFAADPCCVWSVVKGQM